MTAKKLKKLYPEFWDTVENEVWGDMMDAFDCEKNDDSDFSKQRRRVAYNAAFTATHEYHRAISGK
jgi:hypothetical protein